VTVTLPDPYIEQLRRYGDDNLSEGIRLLVEEAHTSTGRPWYVLPERAKDPKAAIHPPRNKRPPVP
jgi:hypothetical protein